MMNVRLNILFDYYGELLTDKQQEIFKDYYFDNLTMQEIADNNEVSKNTSKETSKETSKVKSRETSKETSKESSKVYENSGARQTSDVSQVSYVSTVSN